MRVWGMLIDHLQDGRIKDTRITMETLGLMSQLGVSPRQRPPRSWSTPFSSNVFLDECIIVNSLIEGGSFESLPSDGLLGLYADQVWIARSSWCS